jgi:hypothetical protein
MVMIVEQLAGETEVLGENLPQCRCPPKTAHDLTRDATRAPAVGSRRGQQTSSSALLHGRCSGTYTLYRAGTLTGDVT